MKISKYTVVSLITIALLLTLLGCGPNQKELAEIAKTNISWDARVAAVKKLNDQAVLLDLAKGDIEVVRRAAVEKLTDQAALVDVAKNANYEDVAKSAFEKLTDQIALEDVAKKSRSDDIRKAAITKVINQSVLADIAKNDGSPDIRKAAFEKLTDQAILANFAKNNNVSYAQSAIEKITDQSVLADVARNASSLDIRQAAIEKLTDQVALADILRSNNYADTRDISKNLQYAGIRLAAVKKLTDQAALATIASNDEDGDVLRAALEKLTDQTAIADVAKTAGNIRIRGAAFGQLTDQAALIDVAKNAEDPNIRNAAVEKLTNQSALVDIVKKEKIPVIRQKAIAKLSDQTALADIAKQDKDALIRCAAVANLTDQTVLADISKTDEEPLVRCAAVEKLTDQAVLTDIVRNEKDKTVRRAAIEKGGRPVLLEYSKEGATPAPSYYVSITPEKLDEMAQAIYGADYITVVRTAVAVSKARSEEQAQKITPAETELLKQAGKMFNRVGDFSTGLNENFAQFQVHYKIAALPESEPSVAKDCGCVVGDEIIGFVNNQSGQGEFIFSKERLIDTHGGSEITYDDGVFTRNIMGAEDFITPNAKKQVTISSSQHATLPYSYLYRNRSSGQSTFDMLEDALGAKIEVSMELKTGLTNKELVDANTVAGSPLRGSLPFNFIGSIREARGDSGNGGELWITDLLVNLIKQGFDNLRLHRTDKDGAVLWVITSNDKIVFSLIVPFCSVYAEKYSYIDFLMDKEFVRFRDDYFNLVENIIKNINSDVPAPLPRFSKDGFYWLIGNGFQNDWLITPVAGEQGGKTIDLRNRNPSAINAMLVDKHFEFIQDMFMPKLSYIKDKQYDFTMDDRILLPDGRVVTQDDRIVASGVMGSRGTIISKNYPFNLQHADGYAVITAMLNGVLVTYSFPSDYYDQAIGNDIAKEEWEKQRRQELEQKRQEMIDDMNREDMKERLIQSGKWPSGWGKTK